MSAEDIDIPSEIVGKLENFHCALEKMREVLQPLIKTNVNSSDLKLNPLDRARLNLTCGYALNSLFWMYLTTRGIDPKEHGIKAELERYKSFMMRVKEVADKDKAPSLNKGAAQRFVRNALWEPNKNDDASSSECSQPLKRNIKEERRSDCSREDKKRKKRRR